MRLKIELFSDNNKINNPASKKAKSSFLNALPLKISTNFNKITIIPKSKYTPIKDVNIFAWLYKI